MPVRQVLSWNSRGAHRIKKRTGDTAGLLLTDIRQDRHELLAPKAEEIPVSRRQHPDHASGHTPQRFVALHVGVVVVVRFEIIHVKNNDADPFRRGFIGNERAIRLHRLFIQCFRHHVVVGQLDESVTHFLDVPFVGRLPKEDGPQHDKTYNDGKSQQEMLEQIIVLRVGKLSGQPPADQYQNTYRHGIHTAVCGRDHDRKQIAHGDGQPDPVKVAGDHKDGNAGDHHPIVGQQRKPRRRRIVFSSTLFIGDRKHQHRQRAADHHVKRHHVNGDHRARRDVLDQVDPVGQYKQNGCIKYDRKILPHKDALHSRNLIDLYSQHTITKALKPGKRHIRYPAGHPLHNIDLIPSSFHTIPPANNTTPFVCFC